MQKSLNIAWLYPDLMSIYGDRGNIISLKARCLWRDIEVTVKNITLETSTDDLKSADILFMGGAQDRQQQLAAGDLKKNKGPVLKELIEGGTVGLFICAAYQFLGHYYRLPQEEDIEGLGIFDLYTQHFGDSKPRCVGNVAVDISSSGLLIDDFYKVTNIQDLIFNGNSLVGFENHGGRTYLGDKVVPLGRILSGFGNNGEDGTAGVVYKNTLGSYLHGPLLPKNPHLADYIIGKALENKYGEIIALAPLDDTLEWQAHKKALRITGVSSRSVFC